MLREVDRLLAQLTLAGPPVEERPIRPVGQPPQRAARASRASRPRSTASAPAGHDQLWLWFRVLLGALLGGLMTQWPYRHDCGWTLAGYLGAVLTVMLTGGWIGFASWQLRNAAAHLLALILVFWGIVLAAEQLLPRIGYAAVQAGWHCR